jgi:hypothetical protein
MLPPWAKLHRMDPTRPLAEQVGQRLLLTLAIAVHTSSCCLQQQLLFTLWSWSCAGTACVTAADLVEGANHWATWQLGCKQMLLVIHCCHGGHQLLRSAALC